MIKLDASYLGSLGKGDTIPASVISKAGGVSIHSPDFRIAQLQIRAVVEKHFRDQGVVVTTRSRRNAVIILTDAEASDCCHRRSRHALRKMGRAKRGLEGVDTSQLTDEEKQTHEAKLQQSSFVYIAARQASRRAAMWQQLS